jgi:FixJ family two-component response regulator
MASVPASGEHDAESRPALGSYSIPGKKCLLTMTEPMVLVVDDDCSMRVAIQRLLRVAGFGCETFASAEELLVDTGLPSAACVISDLRLSAMSGLELLTRLRTGGGPPLILITAFDMPGQGEDAGRRGAAAYLVKPFSGAALISAVHAAIDSTTRS